MLPGPMEYLKLHAIAFVAGAMTVVAIRIYAGVRRPPTTKSASNL